MCGPCMGNCVDWGLAAVAGRAGLAVPAALAEAAGPPGRLVGVLAGVLLGAAVASPWAAGVAVGAGCPLQPARTTARATKKARVARGPSLRRRDGARKTGFCCNCILRSTMASCRHPARATGILPRRSARHRPQ